MRCLSFCLVATSLAFTSVLRAGAQQPAPQPNRLESGITIERAITSRQVDTFLVALDSGAMARVALVQHGIDLVVKILDQTGLTLVERDSSRDGPEREALSVAERGGDYRVLVGAANPKGMTGRYSLTVKVVSPAEVAALAAAERMRRAPVIAWTAANAVRLRTVDAGNGFDDMEPLRAMVGDARVVALGEATHGTHEFFALKHRMLEYLVTTMGFNVFAIEAPMPEAFDVNDYVLTGRGNPGAALSGLYSGVWNTEEVLDMIRWMRSYNADPLHTRKVKFYGFDMQFPTRALKVALSYLRRVDAEAARTTATALGVVADPFLAHPLNMSALPRERRDWSDSLLPAARRLLARFDDHRDAYVQRTSLEEWSVARQHARILVQHLEMHATPDWRFRDRAMAENVEWILQHEGPDAKAVLWAHNSHVASNPAQQSTGYHLRQALGHRLAIFGFAFNRGGFVALDSLLQRRAFEVGPAADSSVDGVLAAAGLSLAAVDLRAAPNGPVAEWFAQPHWHQSIGWGYEESSGSRYVFRAMASMLYDVLLFVDSTSAAHTRKNHAPSWQAPLPGPANLDFEDRAADGRPLQWHVAPAPSTEELGFTVVATDERQFRGKRSVMVARVPAHHYGDSFAGLDQVVDATPYRGKWVRLKAMSRAQVRGEESRAHLWLRLRIDNEYSGGDVLRDQTITGRNWSPYEVVVFIPENVATLQFGFALVGDGRAWIADVSLEVVPKPSE